MNLHFIANFRTILPRRYYFLMLSYMGILLNRLRRRYYPLMLSYIDILFTVLRRRYYPLVLSCAGLLLIPTLGSFFLHEPRDVEQRYEDVFLMLPATTQAKLPDIDNSLSSTKKSNMLLSREGGNQSPSTAKGTNLNTEKSKNWRTVTVQQGDSLALIFSRLGLSSKDLYNLISSSAKGEALAAVRPGEVFKIRTDAEDNLLELFHETEEFVITRFSRVGDTFQTNEFNQAVENRSAFKSGTITHSLYKSALQAGMSEPLILAFAEIFRWDVDFALDIQPQDSFTVLYEERFLDGEKVGDGDILAAEFVNHGKMYRAVRYIDSEGNNQYFTPEGRSMRQTFLRSPVDFRRISSRFRPERWHPILGVKRPHRGVDYAAATGTPIWAAGDGKIAFIGTKGGYGKTIILQHGSRYSTLYGHLSRFHKGLKIGSQVRQGDVIGYVGMTGLATGPHLHYEFRIDGKHVNPITVKLPRPLLLNGKQLAEFRRQTAPLIAQLNTHQNAREMMLTQR